MTKYEKKHCKAFGKYLKENRKNAGLTQNMVSEACGFSNAQFISNIERGTCWPPMYVLSMMARLYDVSHNEFLETFTEARKEIWAKAMGL